MPLNLSRSDRKLLAGVCAFFFLMCIAMAVFQPPDDSEEAFPSTYSVRSGGAKATFLLIEKMGLKPERWEKPPSELPKNSRGVVLVMASPIHWPEEAERAPIEQFLKSGGTVIAAGGSSSGFLPHAISRWAPKKSWTTFKALGPSDITRNVPEISMRDGGSWGGDQAVTPLYGTASEAIAVSYPVGEGRVIWLASADPLTNSGIKAKGNAAFIAAAVSAVGAQRVLWDLYFSEARRDQLKSFSSPPLYWGAAQLTGIFLLAIWTYSRRFGPIRPVSAIPRLSPLEFVDALGNLYRQRKATHVAVNVAYRRFRGLAARRLALPAKATTEQVARAACARVGVTEDEMAKVLAACESAIYGPEMKTEEALQLCNELNKYLQQLKLITQEKS